MKFKVGDRVKHTGHGPGTIVELNGVKPNAYLEEKGLDVLQPHPVLLAGAMSSMYNGSRFPYVVQYDPSPQHPEGYCDVYSESELEAL